MAPSYADALDYWKGRETLRERCMCAGVVSWLAAVAQEAVARLGSANASVFPSLLLRWASTETLSSRKTAQAF